jgi:guanyl-specific ribonuclease Sa
MFNRRRITAALIGLIVLVLGGWLVKDVITGEEPGGGEAAPGRVVAGAESGLPVAALSSLPPQAAQTWKLIESHGPFPYPRNDGVVFGNRENLLPQKPSGYYHEYTVPTPGSQDRGPRRLITGDSRELYYTSDHYVSFVVVDPGR